MGTFSNSRVTFLNVAKETFRLNVIYQNNPELTNPESECPFVSIQTVVPQKKRGHVFVTVQKRGFVHGTLSILYMIDNSPASVQLSIMYNMRRKYHVRIHAFVSHVTKTNDPFLFWGTHL